MKNWPLLLLLLLLAPGVRAQDSADAIFLNGNVYTGAPAQPKLWR